MFARAESDICTVPLNFRLPVSRLCPQYNGDLIIGQARYEKERTCGARHVTWLGGGGVRWSTNKITIVIEFYTFPFHNIVERREIKVGVTHIDLSYENGRCHEN